MFDTLTHNTNPHIRGSSHDDNTHEQTGSASTPQQSMRMLLIEDNISDVFLLKHVIVSHSHIASVVFDDAPRMIEALSLLDQHHYDAIILDLHLLDIGGTATIAALRAEAPHVPIFVFSGNKNPKMRTEALLCGARDFFVKGAQNDQLGQAIQSLTLDAVMQY